MPPFRLPVTSVRDPQLECFYSALRPCPSLHIIGDKASLSTYPKRGLCLAAACAVQPTALNTFACAPPPTFAWALRTAPCHTCFLVGPGEAADQPPHRFVRAAGGHQPRESRAGQHMNTWMHWKRTHRMLGSRAGHAVGLPQFEALLVTALPSCPAHHPPADTGPCHPSASGAGLAAPPSISARAAGGGGSGAAAGGGGAGGSGSRSGGAAWQPTVTCGLLRTGERVACV